MGGLQKRTSAMKVFKRKMDRSERLKADSVTRQVFEGFLDNDLVGGIEGIAGFMSETHKMINSSDSIIQRVAWTRILNSSSASYDDLNAQSLEMEMNEEDLHAQILGSLLKALREDPEFAAAVFIETAKTIHAAPEGAEKLEELEHVLESVRNGGEFPEDEMVFEPMEPLNDS